MALIIVGDVDVIQIESEIKKRFTKYNNPKNELKRENIFIKNNKQPIIAIESDKELPNSSVTFLYRDFTELNPLKTIQDFKNSIVSFLATQMLNSRLNDIKDSKNPIFTNAYSLYNNEQRNKMTFIIRANTTQDKIKTTTETLIDETQRIKQMGFLESELERTKKSILSMLELNYSNRNKKESYSYIPLYISNFTLNNTIASDEWNYITYKEILPTITLNEVNKTFQNWIHSENNLSVVITSPEQVIDEDIVLNIFKDDQKKELNAYKDISNELTLIKNKPIPKKIISQNKNNQLDITTLNLENGVKVIYKKTNFKDNQILMNAFKYGGNSLYSTEEYNKTKYSLNALYSFQTGFR